MRGEAGQAALCGPYAGLMRAGLARIATPSWKEYQEFL